MRPHIQIAVDAHDPHALCRFWAAVVDYDVEDHHDQILQLVDQGLLSLEDETIEIDGRRAFATAAACRDPDGVGPRLLFQSVPEPKTVKDRIHLDVHVQGGDDPAALVERLLGMGATKLWDGRQGPQTWVTLADPEGNEFCVS
jgi:hypothetical protein